MLYPPFAASRRSLNALAANFIKIYTLYIRFDIQYYTVPLEVMALRVVGLITGVERELSVFGDRVWNYGQNSGKEAMTLDLKHPAETKGLPRYDDYYTLNRVLNINNVNIPIWVECHWIQGIVRADAFR